MDVDARIQLFDLKTKYQFLTTPGVDKYNMPLYDIQVESGSQNISFYPVYQGFMGPAYVNGVQVPFITERNSFYNLYPNVIQNPLILGQGNGTSGPYNLQIPILSGTNSTPLNPPIQSILRGHIDITGVVATGQNEDPPQVSVAEITASDTFIEDVPVTSVNSQVFITATSFDGSNITVQDSGQFLESNINLGLLMQPGNAPNGNTPLSEYLLSFAITGATQATQCVLTCTSSFLVGEQILITDVVGMTELNDRFFTVVAVGATTVTIDVDSTGFTAYSAGGTASSTRNMINYLTGEVSNLIFPGVVPDGANITAQCYFFQSGLPRSILYYNNTLVLRSPPDKPYVVELDAYLTPAAYLSSAAAVTFGYMCEYIARGAARKILADTGDMEQFNFYEPLFKEQEMLVWKRSQRQFTATRTPTIFSGPTLQTGFNQGSFGN
jgi:hypothetical protein